MVVEHKAQIVRKLGYSPKKVTHVVFEIEPEETHVLCMVTTEYGVDKKQLTYDDFRKIVGDE